MDVFQPERIKIVGLQFSFKIFASNSLNIDYTL